MTHPRTLVDGHHSLLARAEAAWRAARDSQRDGRRIATGLVEEARAARDTPALIAALRARGWAEREELDFPAALASLNEAVRRARRTGLPGQVPAVLATRASIRLELGRVAGARRDIAEARAALGRHADVEVDTQEAIIEDAVGNLRLAARLYRAALEAGGAGIPVETAFTLHNNLGIVLAQLGDLRGSATALEAAEELGRTLGRNKLGYALHNRALTAVMDGDLPGALRLFDDAERLFRDVGQPLAEHYMERMDAFTTLHLLDEALGVADRAVDQLERTRFTLLLGEARLRRARARLNAGDFAGAAADADRAMAELGSSRGPAWRAQAGLVSIAARLGTGSTRWADAAAARRLAEALDRVGFGREAIDGWVIAARAALAVGRPADARRALAEVVKPTRTRSGLDGLTAARAAAWIAEIDGDGPLVRRHAQRGLAALTRFRETLPTTELRALAAGHGAELAAMGLRSALGTGRARDVLMWMERGRVASTLHAPSRGDDPQLAELTARLRATVAAQHLGTADPEARTGLRAEQARLEHRIARRLRLAGNAAAATERVRSPGEVLAATEDRLLVEVAEVDGALVAVLVDGRRMTLRVLGDAQTTRSEAAALMFDVRRLLIGGNPRRVAAAREGVMHTLERLDAAILRPIARALASAGPVTVVPPASLAAIPWHALPSLAGRAVSVVPSATLWLRARERPLRPGRVVTVAGPHLAGAPAEAEVTAGHYDGATVIADPEATVAAVAAALDGATLAHLACHGIFRADNPSFSSLQLSDGPLTVVDIERLERVPGTVVMAACDSGVSESLPGNEVLGLMSALLACGTAAVVASIVPVPDLESTPIMTAFHARLSRGASVAESLAQARAGVDAAEPAGLVATLAYGCFGSGEVTVAPRT